MLKLMKYEFRKWRSALLGMVAGLIALEVGFIAGLALDKTALMSVCLVLIAILTFASFACIVIAGIASYSQDLRQKSGYLLFMVPVPTLGVVLSKLLFIAVTALAATAMFGAAAYFDFRHLILKLDVDPQTLDQLNLVLRFGLKTNATVQQILQIAGFFVVTVLLEVLMTMCTAYLSITLSATLLQNKKGFLRGFISLALFVALTWGSSWIMQKLFYGGVEFDTSFAQMRDALAWSGLANFVFCALFTGASAWLLDHKVKL